MEEKPKHQVIFIRGGESFETKEQFYEYIKNKNYDPYCKKRSWRDWLEWGLSEKFDSFTPLMPNKQWADYGAWKIWFEKLFPFLVSEEDVNLILVGHSLGATFLAKYLSENNFPKKINQFHLVCPAFNDEGIPGEKLGNFKFDPKNLEEIENKAEKIFIYHSKDDPLVPISHSRNFKKYLKKAEFLEFEDRGHFTQPAFMELFNNILNNLN